MSEMLRYAPTRLAAMRQRLYDIGEVTPEYIAYTKHFDLDHKVIQAHAGLFAVVLARIDHDTSGSRIFDFDPDGAPAAVIEVILFDQNREPYVADLVSWPLNDPGSIATALGTGEGADVLGAFNMPQRGRTPLWVHPTPLAWLQAGCEGCVPLKEEGARYWLDRAGGPFIVDGLEEGRWLRDLLGPLAWRHRILVAVPLEEDAA